MDWIQFATILITFVGLFIWNRTESRSDTRHMDTKLESTRDLVRAIRDESRFSMEKYRQETQDLIQVIRQEGTEFRMAMLQESKDFHGRLCAIEERNRKQ